MLNSIALSILGCFLLGNIAAENVKGRPLVVLTTPRGPNDSYYGEWFEEIVGFQKQYASLINGSDNVIIIATEIDGVYDKLACEMPGYVLKGTIKDIWMRDLAAARQKNPILFQYSPDYIQPLEFRAEIRESYLKVLRSYGVNESDFVPSEIILDGGNFVDNEKNSVVITSRVMIDNRPDIGGWDKVLDELNYEIGWKDIAIIPQLKDDTTGHADGMVSFIDTNKLAMTDLGVEWMNDYYLLKLRDQVSADVEVFKIPNKYVPEEWRGFDSACGLHINALTTTDYIYVPTFGHDPANVKKGYTPAYDKEVVDIIKSKTSKTLVQVPVDHDICRMGGSVRCLSWQVEGTIADRLVEAAQQLAKDKKCP